MATRRSTGVCERYAQGPARLRLEAPREHRPGPAPAVGLGAGVVGGPRAQAKTRHARVANRATGHRLRRSVGVTQPRILLTTDVVGGVWDFCAVLARALGPSARVTLLA